MSKLDSLFALEFGQLLENHLFASQDRERELEIILSSLGLKTKNQLAQIYAGYDTPTTASIFELIRTLNNSEFTERFFKLKTVNIGITPNDNVTSRETDYNLSTSDSESPLSGQISCGDRENSPSMCPDRLLTPNSDSDYGGLPDFSLFEIDDE